MTLQTGQVLNNRYRIARLLKVGGFGAVYRAWDLNLQRPCAVKENNQTAPDSQRQFIHEAKILANLNHPNLPRVTDHFILPNQGQYLVMDFIEGKDLGSMLQESGAPLPYHNVQTWILQVCDALNYMHTQNPPIIHRDIKPENIKITPDGRAVLVDFGISKYYDPRMPTTSGARAVTAGYSPPEQYGRGMTDPRTDIYALGATLYTLLTNRVPPDSVDILRDPRQRPPAASTINPSIRPGVSMVIEKAMQIDPNNRHLNVSEFRNALVHSEAIQQPRIMVDQTVQAPAPYIHPGATPPAPAVPSQPQYQGHYAPQPISEPTPMAKQKPRRTGLIYAAIAIIAIVAGFVLFTVLKPEDERAEKTTTRTKEPTAVKTVPAVAQATISEPETEITQPTITTPPQSAAVIPTPWNSEIGVLFNSACRNCHNPTEFQAGMDLTTYQGALRGSTNGPVIVPFDPNNSKVFLVQSRGGHPGQFFPEELDKVRAWIEAGAPEYGFVYSPVATQPPAEAVVPTSPPAQASGPEWPPPMIAYVRGTVGDSDIFIFNPASGKNSSLVTGDCDHSDPAWSPDVSTIAYQSNCDGSYDIWQINVSGGVSYNLTNSPGLDEREPYYSPDGYQVVYQRVPKGGKTDQDGEIVVQDLLTGNISSLGIKGRNPTYSADGSSLTFMSKMTGTWQIYTYLIDTGSLNQLTNCEVNCRFSDWSPDGKSVVFNLAKDNLSITPNGIMYTEIATGKETPLIPNQPVGRPDWSASGWIAFNTNNEGIEIILPDGSQRQFLIKDKAAWGPSWSR